MTRLWGRGVPGPRRGLQVAFWRSSSAGVCTRRGLGSAPAHKVWGSGVRGGGADPDLACSTAGSGARETLAARRPRPSDRPEAGPRKPTCQSYRPAEWARGSSQRDPGAPGVRFCAGPEGLLPSVGKGSPAAPWVRGRRLGPRPDRVPCRSLCVGVGEDGGLQGAGLGILVLAAFSFI